MVRRNGEEIENSSINTVSSTQRKANNGLLAFVCSCVCVGTMVGHIWIHLYTSIRGHRSHIWLGGRHGRPFESTRTLISSFIHREWCWSMVEQVNNHTHTNTPQRLDRQRTQSMLWFPAGALNGQQFIRSAGCGVLVCWFVECMLAGVRSTAGRLVRELINKLYVLSRGHIMLEQLQCSCWQTSAPYGSERPRRLCGLVLIVRMALARMK